MLGKKENLKIIFLYSLAKCFGSYLLQVQLIYLPKHNIVYKF